MVPFSCELLPSRDKKKAMRITHGPDCLKECPWAALFGSAHVLFRFYLYPAERADPFLKLKKKKL
jgi:hypothetical protein